MFNCYTYMVVFLLTSITSNSQIVDTYLSKSNFFRKNNIEKINYDTYIVGFLYENNELKGLSLKSKLSQNEELMYFLLKYKETKYVDGIKFYIYNCRLTIDNDISNINFEVYISSTFNDFTIFYSFNSYQIFTLDNFIERFK